MTARRDPAAHPHRWSRREGDPARRGGDGAAAPLRSASLRDQRDRPRLARLFPDRDGPLVPGRRKGCGCAGSRATRSRRGRCTPPPTSRHPRRGHQQDAARRLRGGTAHLPADRPARHRPDFKDMHRLQLGERRSWRRSTSRASERGSLVEGKESDRVETWGKVIGITRQVIINDDSMPSPPSLRCSAPLRRRWKATSLGDRRLQSGHGGRGGGVPCHPQEPGRHGTALDVASLGKARAQMAKRPARRQDGLDIRPALVVPSSLELTAEQLSPRTWCRRKVPSRAGLDPLARRNRQAAARSGLGGGALVLLASPSAIDTIEYAYLEGQEGVSIETRMASTSTASRSRRGSTSAPRRSTGAASPGTPASRRSISPAAASGHRPLIGSRIPS